MRKNAASSVKRREPQGTGSPKQPHTGAELQKLIDDHLRQFPHLPLYIAKPRPGKCCPISGYSLGKINSLTLPTKENSFCPPVFSATDAKPGKREVVRNGKAYERSNQARRMVLVPSLLAYMRKITQPAAKAA